MLYLSPNHQELLKTAKIAVYKRKSTVGEDKQVQSIPAQRLELQEIVDEFKLKVAPNYDLEETQSAFHPGRPKFDKLLELIRNGEVNVVLTWSPNRIARNYADGGQFVQLMSEGKINLVITPHGIFENTPKDREYLMTEFTRATRDSDDKSVGVKRGHKFKLNLGHVPSGRLIEGYIHALDDNRKKVNAPDPERFHLLKQALSKILTQEMTVLEALDHLNNTLLYRTRKTNKKGDTKLSRSGFYNLLSNPILYGKIERKEGSFDAKFQTLLTEDEFEKLQIILGSVSPRKKPRKTYAYNGLMKCDHCSSSVMMDEKWHIKCTSCGKKFHRSKKAVNCPKCKLAIKDMVKPKIYHYIYLYCGRSKKLPDGSKCHQPALKILDFEQQIDTALDSLTVHPKFVEWALKWMEILNEKSSQNREAELNKVADLIAINERRRKSAVTMMLDKRLDPEEYDNITSELKLELAEIKKQQDSLLKDSDDWLDKVRQTFNFTLYAKKWFEKGDPQLKRLLIQTLDTNLLLNNKQILIRPQKPFVIIQKMKEILENEKEKFEPLILLDHSDKKQEYLDSIPHMMPDLDSNQD